MMIYIVSMGTAYHWLPERRSVYALAVTLAVNVNQVNYYLLLLHSKALPVG